jgi:hypothetical protein
MEVPYSRKICEGTSDRGEEAAEGKRGITLERWVNFVHYGA